MSTSSSRLRLAHGHVLASVPPHRTGSPQRRFETPGFAANRIPIHMQIQIHIQPQIQPQIQAQILLPLPRTPCRIVRRSDAGIGPPAGAEPLHGDAVGACVNRDIDVQPELKQARRDEDSEDMRHATPALDG